LIDVLTLVHGIFDTRKMNDFIHKNLDGVVCNKLFILLNGFDRNDEKIINYFNSHDKRKDIVLVFEENNIGSASGFSTLMKKSIIDSSNNYIFLLDNDNYINKSSSDLEKMKNEVLRKKIVIYQREDRPYLSKILNGEKISNVLPPIDSCLGFDYVYLLKKISKRIFFLKTKKSNKKDNDNLLPYAPYGGLVINKKLIIDIGFPNEDYFVYCDDYEFTARISREINGIPLSNSLLISDMDKSWNYKNSLPFWLNILKAKQKNRIYYSIRNRLYFEKDNYTNSTRYKINYFTITIFLKIFSRFSENADVIKTAFSDYKNNVIGKSNKYSI